ncbi:MAG: DUF4105 domain-containing protein [Ferruginibacter sp.]
MFVRIYLVVLAWMFFWVMFPVSSSAQDSSRIRVSLITCSPGSELYSIFGHSAIRVTDSNRMADMVLNYGTFDFSDPDFYLKFVQGKLNYYLSIQETTGFILDYQYMSRSVVEQVLLLPAPQKINLVNALIENSKPENRFYLYDFFLDNCTTRLRDILLQYGLIDTRSIPTMPANTTYRQAIHEYLKKGDHPWSMLGIDLLLGAKTDRVMTLAEQQFLPDNLLQAVDRIDNHQSIVQKATLYEAPEKTTTSSFFSPLFVISLVAIGLLVLTSIPTKKSTTVTRGIDLLIFSITAILGWIILLAWTATDHTMTKNNYNLCWALPTHLLSCYLLFKQTVFARRYFFVLSCLMVFVIACWFFLPQTLHPAILPWVALMAIRSWLLSRSVESASS